MSILVSNTYSRFYWGIDAYGEGPLYVKDIRYHDEEDFRRNQEPVSFILSSGVTTVEAGFFDIFITIAELVVSDTVKRIDMSEKSVKLFQKNHVTVRAAFDSYGEAFAKKYKLRFLHEDIELTRHGDYFERGANIITLCFRPDGSPFIHQDCLCQGSSAGSSGGGEVSLDLPGDFCKKLSREDIADMVWGSCYSGVLHSEKLRTFLEKAKERKGYQVQY